MQTHRSWKDFPNSSRRTSVYISIGISWKTVPRLQVQYVPEDWPHFDWLNALSGPTFMTHRCITRLSACPVHEDQNFACSTRWYTGSPGRCSRCLVFHSERDTGDPEKRYGCCDIRLVLPFRGKQIFFHRETSFTSRVIRKRRYFWRKSLGSSHVRQILCKRESHYLLWSPQSKSQIMEKRIVLILVP